MNTQSSNKIAYINALKGIASVGVFIHHLLIILLPATYTGLLCDSKINGDYLLGRTPLGIVINGNFWVCVFFVISTFIFSSSVFKNKADTTYISKALLKRYPRLMLPILAVNILSMLLFQVMRLFFDITNVFQDGWASMLTISLFQIWFGDTVEVSGYWMMGALFWSSIGSIILSMILFSVKRKSIARILLTSLLTILVIIDIDTCCLSVVFGVWISYELYIGNLFSDIREIINKRKHLKVVLMVLLSITIIILGGYPSSSNHIFVGVYSLFAKLPEIFIHYHMIAAVTLIVMMEIFNIKNISSPVLDFLGRISYSTFLVHPFVNAYFATPFYSMISSCCNIYVSCAVVFVSTIVITFAASILFYKFIESKTVVLSNSMVRKVLM